MIYKVVKDRGIRARAFAGLFVLLSYVLPLHMHAKILTAGRLSPPRTLQVSEISLFFVARAQHLQLIQRHHYLVAVATTIILMVASPLVIKALQTIHGGSGSSGGGGECLPGGLIGGGGAGGVGVGVGMGGGSGGGLGDSSKGSADNSSVSWRSPARGGRRKLRESGVTLDAAGIAAVKAAASAAASAVAAGATEAGGSRGSGNGNGSSSREHFGTGDRGSGTRRRVHVV